MVGDFVEKWNGKKMVGKKKGEPSIQAIFSIHKCSFCRPSEYTELQESFGWALMWYPVFVGSEHVITRCQMPRKWGENLSNPPSVILHNPPSPILHKFQHLLYTIEPVKYFQKNSQ